MVHRFFSLRISLHLDALSVVNQPVQDAVGPASDRRSVHASGSQAACDVATQRADLIQVLADLPEATALWFRLGIAPPDPAHGA